MSSKSTKKGKFLNEVAEKNGVAVVILNGRNKEIAAANNNSICKTLWNSARFRPACDRDCGSAFAKTANGQPFDYECHAGLTCRAIPVEDRGNRFVAIVGRTFMNSANYRTATERAISGEWSKFKPTEFFENILMSGTSAGIESASDELAKFTVSEPDDILEIKPKTETRAAESRTDELAEMVRRFNETAPVEREAVKAAPFPAQPMAEAADAAAIRSLVGSLMRQPYLDACGSVLDFLQRKHRFSSLIWLERSSDMLRALITKGELQGKPIRINLPADNERLIAAADNDKPLILRERRDAVTGSSGRTLSLFPSKVGNEIRSAVAIESEISDTDLVNQIVRISKAVAPQIEILRLRDEVSSRDSLARGLKKFNQSLRRVDADDFWLHVTQASAELLGAERASLLVLDESSDKLNAKAAIGSAIDLQRAENVGGRIAMQALMRGRPMTVSDLPSIGVESAPREWQYRSQSFISFPIAIGDRRIAVMNFTDRPGGDAFGERDLDLLNTISPQIAVAIDRTRFKTRAGQFEQRSITDSLTGLRNRGYLEERLTEEISQARRYRASMCLLMIDVDNFKSYNDSFGHPAGDAVLKLVANAFRETLRTADVAARYGGEEFAILLPHTSNDEGAAIAERIRQRVERSEFPNRHVTISLGIASYANEFEEPKDWITAADMALYEAKGHGRNNIRIYEQLGRSFKEKIN